MNHRIHNRFKYGVHGKLRCLDSVRCFDGVNTHIPFNKLAGFSNLNIQRSGNVFGIQLIARVPLDAAIADCLYESARHK